MLDARVVDQDVNSAPLGFACTHHGFDLAGLAHVGAVIGHLGAQAANVGQRAFHVTKAIEHDVRALFGQLSGNAQANAAGRTGDEGRLA